MDIYIYTNYPKESNKDNTIYNNDARFNNYTINNLHGDLDDIGKEVIKQIDRAIILENNKIETPRGITYLTDLSSGCKTVLNYRNKLDVQYIKNTFLKSEFIQKRSPFVRIKSNFGRP